jgi:hypothetical protein
VDHTGSIVREMKVVGESEALVQVLENPIYRFKRIGLEVGPFSGARACTSYGGAVPSPSS